MKPYPPDTRLMLANQLKIRPKKYQQIHYQSDCSQVIKDFLSQMSQRGYTFLYSSKKVFTNKSDLKQLRRKVKLRIFCDKCQNEWTTIVGTMEITFAIEKIEDKDLVVFTVRLYKMKCIKCREDGTPRIYDSQLCTIAEIFCLVLSEIFLNVTRKRYKKDNRYKMNEDAHKHEEELCEACRWGKCFNVPKEKKY